jgi:effector-binding domain-containing protein
VPAAHVIRRLRDLEMPLDDVRAVLGAADAGTRDAALVVHLERMERRLEETQSTVASLRALLDGSEPPGGRELVVEHRRTPPGPALAVRAVVEWDETEEWLAGAFAELAVQPDERDGPDSALYSPEYFEAHVGEIVAYVPLVRPVPGAGRTVTEEIPGAHLAVTLHRGSFAELDRVYGALGSYVTERAIGAPGPVREHYLDPTPDAPDVPRTEVAWPIEIGRETA